MVTVSLRRYRKDIGLLTILVGMIVIASLSLFYYIVTRQLVYVLFSVLFGLMIVIEGLVGYRFDVFSTKYEFWRTVFKYWNRKKTKQSDSSESSNS